ncbi:S8 family serine peptidase [Jiulongibacter sediminis]|jgi:hypothetical protein|uniref:S8 family serine peptidase n=1 Tax=Jiulongibacter sediminis TaxID=1605367 RepID=UPI0026EB7D25|nr:S8 family serine peptidase [Jiulongibacter sediminis]
MRLIANSFLIVVLLGLMPGSSMLWAQQINDEFVEGEIYVKLKVQKGKKGEKKNSPAVNLNREIPGLQRKVEVAQNKVKEAKQPFYSSKNEGLQNVYRLKLENGKDIDKLVKELKADPDIEYAERVRIRKIIAVPNDTLYNDLWHLKKIKASEAWDVIPGQVDVVVAVVDNAIQVTHPDLALNMVAGRDVADNDNDPNPPNNSFSHGTHVAGIVSAVNNNVTGIASAGNNKVKVMPIKATPNSSDPNFIYNGFDGIAWATANNANIISLSWGGPGFSQLEQDVIDDAYNNGILVIAAAGNEDSDEPQYPASYNHVISVAALDSTDQRSYFSSYGTGVDISAPGRFILSTVPTNNYASFSGTSMATPLVASCAGYLLSCFPSLSPDSVEYILKKTADNIDTQNPNYLGQLGSGRINLLKAVSCKDVDLFAEEPLFSPTNFFCEGDSVLLSINPIGAETFEWFVDEQLKSTNSAYFGKEEGSWILKRTLGTCSINSDPIQLIYNRTLTPIPELTALDVSYCDLVNTELVATPAGCDAYGPQTFTYNGPVVGFDGYAKSNPYPTVEVSGMGGLIDSVSISITWQKLDGGDVNYCGSPDLGSRPWNDEVSFSILSPEGLSIPLLNEGTYAFGTGTSGVVTTVFTTNGALVADGSDPVSGHYKAAGDLGQLQNRIAQGTWTLIANDNYLIDPLCVSGFEVIVKTNEPLLPTAVKWYESPESTVAIHNGETLSLVNNQVGETTYWARAQCDGMCPSEPVKTKVRVRPIPEIFAYSLETLDITIAQAVEIMNAQSLDYSVDNNIYTLFGINSSGQPFSYQVSDEGPMTSPVSLCESNSFVVFGMGCQGTISWSNGESGTGFIVEGLNTPLALTATCNQSWECAPLSNIPFDFIENNTNLTLGGIVPVNLVQDFYGQRIESSQLLEAGVKSNYVAPTSILLQPGFEASNSVIFSAEIGDCAN